MTTKKIISLLILFVFLWTGSFGFDSPSKNTSVVAPEDGANSVFQIDRLGEINSSFETHVGMFALEYLDGMIYGVDGLTSNLFVYDAETGTSVANHTIATGSQGITTDGTYLYTSVYTLSPPNGTIVKYDTSGTELSRIHVPVGAGTLVGLTWDGVYLWGFQSTPSSLLQINPVNGQVVKNITVSFNSQGLAWFNQKIWVVNWGFDQVYAIHPSTGEIIDSYSSPYHFDSGLAINGTHFIQSRYIDSMDPFEISFTKIPTQPGDVFTGSNMILASLRDIAYSGQHYFLSEDGSSNILVFNPGLYGFDSSWDTGITPIGLTVIEEDYLMVSSGNSPYNVYTFSFDGTMLVNHSALGMVLDSLTYDGTFLWAMGSDDILYKLNPIDMSILSQFPIGDFAGITYDSLHDVIWAVSPSDHTIRYINTSSGDLGDTTIPLNPPITAGEYGLTFNGEYLVVSTSAGGGYFYQIILGPLDAPNEPIQTTSTSPTDSSTSTPDGIFSDQPVEVEYIFFFTLGFATFGILMIFRRLRKRGK